MHNLHRHVYAAALPYGAAWTRNHLPHDGATSCNSNVASRAQLQGKAKCHMARATLTLSAAAIMRAGWNKRSMRSSSGPMVVSCWHASRHHRFTRATCHPCCSERHPCSRPQRVDSCHGSWACHPTSAVTSAFAHAAVHDTLQNNLRPKQEEVQSDTTTVFLCSSTFQRPPCNTKVC